MTTSKKRKWVERLDEDEALVVAPVAFWNHAISVYEAMADREPDVKEWMEAADFIRLWVHTTEYQSDLYND